jgi:DNA end-binding protein Ku
LKVTTRVRNRNDFSTGTKLPHAVLSSRFPLKPGSVFRGPACVLERLSQALARLVSDRCIPRQLRAREDQLPSAQQKHRQPHQIPQGRCRDGRRSDPADIVKGYEVGKGEYIEMQPEELDAIALESKRTIEIDQFVPRKEIDELYFRDPYYIVPDGEVGQQAFAVIREAIRSEGMVALAKIVFTSRQHIIALEARGNGLMGVTLRYPYEVREEQDYFDDIAHENVPKDMLDLATHIVDTKRGKFEPEKFEDDYEEALKELLQKKQRGEKIDRPKDTSKSNVVNLMDALRKSLRDGGSGKATKPSVARLVRKGGKSATKRKKAG